MSALIILLAIAASLLVLGAMARVAPRPVPALRAVLCCAGLVAALFAPGVAIIEQGTTFATDGLASTMLAALFLFGACGAAGPVALGATSLAILAGDAITLLALTAAASLTTPAWRPKTIALGALAIAMPMLAWHGTWHGTWHGALPDPRFAAIRAVPPGSIAGGLALMATLVATVALPTAMPGIPGALLALTIAARLLLDLPGPVAPGWWGVPIVLLGATASVVLARRTAAAPDLASAIHSALQATLALALSGIGVALLARGADLPPLAAFALTACFLLVLTAALWGSLALLTVAAIQSACGTTALARLGGLLRRVPSTGLALLIALASVAALPLSAGFAALWSLLQALLGAARLGSVAMLALSAGAVAALGLTLALLAAASLRIAGHTLLGEPRSAKAAAAREPPVAVRIAMAGVAASLLIAGLFPALLVQIAQPAIRQLTGGGAEGATLFGLSITADMLGYAAPLIAGLLALCIAAAVWASRGEVVAAPIWRGGLADDGPARANTMPLLLWPDWRGWLSTTRPLRSSRLVLAALALLLAAAIGWAAR